MGPMTVQHHVIIKFIDQFMKVHGWGWDLLNVISIYVLILSDYFPINWKYYDKK